MAADRPDDDKTIEPDTASHPETHVAPVDSEHASALQDHEPKKASEPGIEHGIKAEHEPEEMHVFESHEAKTDHEVKADNEAKIDHDLKSDHPHKPRSEWTASDDRGPLGTAGELSPTAEAGHDAPTQGVSATERHASAIDPVAAPHAAYADEPRKTSALPIAAGLVIGALIGAGSAAFVYNYMGQPKSTEQAGTADPQVSSLASRVAALEKRPDPQAALAGLKGDVSDLDAKLASLGKSAPSAATKTMAMASPPVDLAPIQQKIAALQTGLDALKSRNAETKQLQDKIAALQTDIAGAKKETSATQAGMAGVETKQKALSDKVMVPALAVVADSLVQQIGQGQPYTAQVEALTALGADPVKIAILRQNAEKGVPSAKTLAAKFEPLAEPISATAHKAPPNAGFVDRLKSGMFSMVSVRNADDTSGTDLPSRVARIRAALAHDDVADALATWGALPADAQAKGTAWSALAKTSADAMSAARDLQHEAIVALGTKKS